MWVQVLKMLSKITVFHGSEYPVIELNSYIISYLYNDIRKFLTILCKFL